MLDKFRFFCLPIADQQYLEQWISPGGEQSILKQIPIEEKDRVRDLCLKMGLQVRVVYRGPRLNQIDPSFTRKEDAERFTLYPI
jgi:hypothetical protein